MLKLYYTPGTCSLAPHIALEEAGERYELARVDLAANQQNSPDFVRLNPKARVPVLTDGDWALTEAPAILRYIAARHPASGLWPWDPREEARCAEWLGWLSSTVHVSAGYVRRAARYASDPRAVEDVAATGRKTCRTLWEAVEQRIGRAGGRSANATASPILICWFIGCGGAARFLITTWRTIFRAGPSTRAAWRAGLRCSACSSAKACSCRIERMFDPLIPAKAGIQLFYT